MTDLVKRLRAPPLAERNEGIKIEAADEIERLRTVFLTMSDLQNDLEAQMKRLERKIKQTQRDCDKVIGEQNSLIGKMAAKIKKLKRLQ